MKHHQCFDACLLTEKLTIIASFYISVFSHYKSSRRARVAVLDADESRRPKESKSALHASCEESLSVNGRIGETALLRLRGTFHSLLLHETSHTSKSAFKDFFLKNNKLELLSRGLHMVRVMLERRLS